jgi:multiple sugar transport system permease protein
MAIELEQKGRTPKARWLSPQLKANITGYLFISPWLVGFLTLVAGAMVASLGISFLKTDLMQETQFVGLMNYRDILRDELVGKALVNTAYYSFAMVPLGTATALVIALLLNQNIRGLGFFRTVYYLPAVVAGVAVSLLWMWMYNPDLGLINGLLAKVGIRGPRWLYGSDWAMPSLIIMSVWGSGGSMLIFLAGLQGIPTALYEAAKIDGANTLRQFWHVTIPMLTPTIFFSVIMRIIGSWQVFTQVYIMTNGGPNNATLTMVLLLYRKAFMLFRFGYGSAIAWVLFAIIMVFTVIVFRSSALWVYYAGEVKK